MRLPAALLGSALLVLSSGLYGSAGLCQGAGVAVSAADSVVDLPPPGPLLALIDTERGVIRIELFAARVPLTVANFVNLTRRGFYDGLTFHRVYDDQFVQGGSPTGRSDGGPGYTVDNELVAELSHSGPGIVSMGGGPGGNGSQFFITRSAIPYLDGWHTVFGRVLEGQAVVDALEPGDVMRRVAIEGDPTSLLERARDTVELWNTYLDGAPRPATPRPAPPRPPATG